MASAMKQMKRITVFNQYNEVENRTPNYRNKNR